MRVGTIGQTVLLKLEWAWMPLQNNNVQIWSCLPGYLPASGGTWTDHALVDWGLQLYDYEGNLLGLAGHMDLDWTGYPLAELQGANGPFTVLRNGGILPVMCRWEMLSV